MKRILLLAVGVALFAACGLFTQKPVCPSSKPNCWMNDPAMPDPRGPTTPFGASSAADAAPQG